jgi:hypothetical protein
MLTRLIVSNKGSQINGSTSTKASLENEVIFEGDRLEALYDNVLNKCYLLTDGSTNNSINHLNKMPP